MCDKKISSISIVITVKCRFFTRVLVHIILVHFCTTNWTEISLEKYLFVS